MNHVSTYRHTKCAPDIRDSLKNRSMGAMEVEQTSPFSLVARHYRYESGTMVFV